MYFPDYLAAGVTPRTPACNRARQKNKKNNGTLWKRENHLIIKKISNMNHSVKKLCNKGNQSRLSEEGICNKGTLPSLSEEEIRAKRQKRRTWTEDDVKELEMYFREYIEAGNTPTGPACDSAKQKSQNSHGTLWKRPNYLIMKKIRDINHPAQRPKRKTVHQAWTNDEVKELKVYFPEYFKAGKTPRGDACNRAKQKSKESNGTLWKRENHLIIKKISNMNHSVNRLGNKQATEEIDHSSETGAQGLNRETEKISKRGQTWSDEEVKELKMYFREYLEAGITPRRDACHRAKQESAKNNGTLWKRDTHLIIKKISNMSHPV